jgi:hypothetical protein
MCGSLKSGNLKGQGTSTTIFTKASSTASTENLTITVETSLKIPERHSQFSTEIVVMRIVCAETLGSSPRPQECASY